MKNSALWRRRKNKANYIVLCAAFSYGVLTDCVMNLKKQTQFMPAWIGVRSYLKGDYDNIPACEALKNKANQSQSFDFAQSLPWACRRDMFNIVRRTDFSVSTVRHPLRDFRESRKDCGLRRVWKREFEKTNPIIEKANERNRLS
jgi:hypothetical protein